MHQTIVFYVSGLGGRTLMTADQTFGTSLKLVGIDDPKVQREIGPERRRIYRGQSCKNGIAISVVMV